MCCLSLEKWSWTASKEKDFRISDARIIAGLGSLSWALITLFLDKHPHFKWWCKQLWGWGADYHHHSLLRWSLPWESDQSVRALQLVPSSSVQLSVQQIQRPCYSLCVPFQAHQSTPLRGLKGSSGDRKSVHVISHVSVLFAFCFDTWSPYASERPVKWDILALHSWGSVGLSSEGINSAANRSFHLAYRHSISMSLCILLPAY